MAANDPPQPPPMPPAMPVWRGLHGLTNALTVAFTINVLIAAWTVIALMRRIGVANDLEDLGSLTSNERISIFERGSSADDLVHSAWVSMLVMGGVTAVLFIIWMWRAAKNNQALDRPKPRFGPGWAIGGWFIPIANVVIPVLVMQDFWRGSDRSIPRGDTRWKIADRSALVGWWWGLFLGSRLVSALGADNAGELRSFADLRRADTFDVVGSLGTAAAAIVAIAMIRAIAQRQLECLRVQNERWGQQSGGTVAPAN